MSSYSMQTLQLIEAVRRLSLNDDLFLPPTQKQLVKMNIQIAEAIDDDTMNSKVKKALRIRVLRLLTGLPIASSKQLTRKSISVIIDLTLNGQANEQLRELAKKSIEA